MMSIGLDGGGLYRESDHKGELYGKSEKERENRKAPITGGSFMEGGWGGQRSKWHASAEEHAAPHHHHLYGIVLYALNPGPL